MTRKQFGGSRFPDDDNTDCPRKVGLLAIDHLTWLLAREYFNEYSRRETSNYTTTAPLNSIPEFTLIIVRHTHNFLTKTLIDGSY